MNKAELKKSEDFSLFKLIKPVLSSFTVLGLPLATCQTCEETDVGMYFEFLEQGSSVSF